jgi:hypothetical protein
LVDDEGEVEPRITCSSHSKGAALKMVSMLRSINNAKVRSTYMDPDKDWQFLSFIAGWSNDVQVEAILRGESAGGVGLYRSHGQWHDRSA